jgi:hypothetical protein
MKQGYSVAEKYFIPSPIFNLAKHLVSELGFAHVTSVRLLKLSPSKHLSNLIWNLVLDKRQRIVIQML